MPTFRTAEVTGILAERPGLQRMDVLMPDGSPARAYALVDTIGTCAVGDRVILNTTACDLALGTGGWHVVHWNLARDGFSRPGPDHVMKLRYTSLQIDAGTDELAHPEVDLPLGAAPVVACSVHSQVALVALGFAAGAPGRRLAYVMTDGAALPVALSDLVDDLRRRRLVVGVVSAGHAFGGDLEAVSIPSALGLAVHVLEADAVVVGMGPGVVGTGTALGTTAVEVAAVLDVASRLGGQPVMCVRASDADERDRHRGISHHSATAAALTYAAPWVAPVPADATGLPGVRAAAALAVPDPTELLAASGLAVTTMGRGPAEDPIFFRAAVAAGALAARLLPG